MDVHATCGSHVPIHISKNLKVFEIFSFFSFSDQISGKYQGIIGNIVSLFFCGEEDPIGDLQVAPTFIYCVTIGPVGRL